MEMCDSFAPSERPTAGSRLGRRRMVLSPFAALHISDEDIARDRYETAVELFRVL